MPPISSLLALAVQAASTASAGEPAAPASWANALLEDVAAFDGLILDSHPGPVDVENPEFLAEMAAARKLALARSHAARTYEDWYFALSEYQAAFNDGHLVLHDFASLGHDFRYAWPGFVTSLKEGAGESDVHVVTMSEDPAGPPIGAVLIDCDGRPSDALAADIVGRNVGRWSLRSRRVRFAGELFLDKANPYVDRPEICTFDTGAGAQSFSLNWRAQSPEDRDRALQATRPVRYTAPIGMRRWSGGVWISLGAFDAGPAGGEGARLASLQAEVEVNAYSIRNAPRLVFDLRGNNGGSSAWIVALANALWGEDWVAAHAPEPTSVEWRTSTANLATIESYRARAVDRPEAASRLEEIADGIRSARSAHQPLWRQVFTSRPVAVERPATTMSSRVFVVTDLGCASACLDAVDLLLALGATLVGQETAADTVYMEARSQRLPSGRATAVIPMKVYRGHQRRSNEPAVPQIPWAGDMSDTAGLEALILQRPDGRW